LAQAAWVSGHRVVKLIGYDCSPADNRRYAHREGYDDPRFVFRYPLREWGWTRSDCAVRIKAAGLSVPVKSSCFFCAAMKPDEVRSLPGDYLRLIVLIEARAGPRLRSIDGLWRKPVKGKMGAQARPGSMTAFIRQEALLPEEEIDDIVASAPAALLDFQRAAALSPVEGRASMKDWLARFHAGASHLAA